MAVIVTDGGGRQLVDLEASFGGRYRVAREAGGATWRQWAPEDRPWLVKIRGRYGTVYPMGGELLGAWSESPRIAAKLQALPCVIQTRGSEAITFHVQDASAVFSVLRPYRRRQGSEAERARLREIGTQALARHRSQANVQSDFSELERAGDAA